MKYHEYANIYRMLPEAELQKLAENIKTMGQLLPITSYEGKILDGRNRYQACQIAKVEPRIEEYTGDDPLGLIASLNDHRRHDEPSERAMVGARMANLIHGGQGGKLNSSMETLKPAITIERAAELSGSTPASIKRAKPIVQSGIPELQDMVDRGEVSIRTGSKVAKLAEAEQVEAVSKGAHGVNEAAKKARSTNSPDVDPVKRPAEESPALSDTDVQRGDRAEQDSEKLWLLKSTWNKASKKDKSSFIQWTKNN